MIEAGAKGWRGNGGEENSAACGIWYDFVVAVAVVVVVVGIEFATVLTSVSPSTALSGASQWDLALWAGCYTAYDQG